MKIYINNSNENWICDRMRKEIMTHGGPSYFTENPSEASIVWLFANWIWKQTSTEILYTKKIAVTIHHIDPDKLDVEDFIIRDQFVDAYHVFSEKTIKNFPSDIDKLKIHVVPYWYNENLWVNIPEKQPLKQKHSIPEDKFIIGSFQRDTEGLDLKTPKLSKGPDTFCDIVEQLNPKPHIILSGWRRQYIINRLNKAGIKYSYFEMADFNTLNELYNCLDLYLVTSRQEGGPQAVLECASNKTPILSTDVGFANKTLTESSILNDSADFIKKIESNDFDHTTENYQKIQKFRMENVFSKYLDFFKSI